MTAPGDCVEGVLDVPEEIVSRVVKQAMALDGSPILHGQVRKTLRALIALGWNDWPEVGDIEGDVR